MTQGLHSLMPFDVTLETDFKHSFRKHRFRGIDAAVNIWTLSDQFAQFMFGVHVPTNYDDAEYT